MEGADLVLARVHLDVAQEPVLRGREVVAREDELADLLGHVAQHGGGDVGQRPGLVVACVGP